MIYRARMPSRKALGLTTHLNQRDYFETIPEEYRKELVFDICATNRDWARDPMLAKHTPYVFVIAPMKPIDSENFIWEEMPKKIERNNSYTRRYNKRPRRRYKHFRNKYKKNKEIIDATQLSE